MNYIRPAANFIRWALPTGLGVYNAYRNVMGYGRRAARPFNRGLRRFGGGRRRTFRRRTFRRRTFRRPMRRRRTFKRSFKRRGYSKIPAFSNKGFRNVTVVYKNIQELQYRWTLTASEPTTKPQFVNFVSPWLPPEGTAEEADAAFTRYRVHKIKKFTWKVDNFRIFKSDYQLIGPATEPVAPGVQAAQTERINKWRFWYKRDSDRLAETLKPNEEQMTQKDIWGPKTKIWGTQHYRPGGLESKMAEITTAELHAHTLDTYWDKFGATPQDNLGSFTPITRGMFLMPDDPLPAAAMTGKRQCILDVVADLTTYTTFSLWDRKKDTTSAKTVKVIQC